MGEFWEALSAVSTAVAAIIALCLGLHGAWMSRTARKIGVWVTQQFDFDPYSDSYIRSVQLHLSNEGDEPVFHVDVSVFAGFETKEHSIGPLSAPVPIQVLAPRQQLDFDISTGVRAYDDSWKLMAEAVYEDSAGRKWRRDRNGRLRRVRHIARLEPLNLSVEQELERLGIQPGKTEDGRWLVNPLAVAAVFLNFLNDDEFFAKAEFNFLLADEADGWNDVDWSEVRSEWRGLVLTSFAQYPAPRIAQIKLVGPACQGKQLVNGGILMTAKIMTLTLGAKGWRIYDIGCPLAPEEIRLPHLLAGGL